MKIGLVSALMKDNDIDHQLVVMEGYLKENKTCQMLCFGECFLQGFDALSWDYKIDKYRALKLESEAIKRVKDLAKKYACAVSTGFIELYNDSIYCTNLVIDRNGEVADIYRRISEGWKIEGTSSHYKEGRLFHSFTLEGIKFATAICGDLWYDKNVEMMGDIEKDIILWPMYIDFSKKRWDISEEEQYIEKAAMFGVPALMYNSLKEEPKGANGGCNIFSGGKLVAKLPMGEQGVLEVDLNDLLS
nr:carbon-nitrogen hydrolase family protein [Tissierella sp.]